MNGLLKILLSMDNHFFRKQNREYCEYLLKVLYHESSKVEDESLNLSVTILLLASRIEELAFK